MWFLRYFLYIAFSSGIGFLSWISGVENDFIYSLHKSFLQILISIFVAYGTLSNVVLTQLGLYAHNKKANIESAIDELRRNIRIESVILIIDVFIVVISSLMYSKDLLGVYDTYRMLFLDIIISFSLLYFLYVVYDTTMGFYLIFSENQK